jgi:cytochrome c
LLKPNALAIAVALASTSAMASSVDTIEQEGFAFAKAHCAECHRIVPDDVSVGHFEAPSFQVIADDPAMTATSLRVFLRTPHSRMPDFILSDKQTQDVINYILSLK